MVLMRRTRKARAIIAATVLGVVLAGCIRSDFDGPWSVSLVSVLVDRGELEGKRLRVMGYLSENADRLYLTKEHFDNFDQASSVAILNRESVGGVIRSEACNGSVFGSVVGTLWRQGPFLHLREVEEVSESIEGSLFREQIPCWTVTMQASDLDRTGVELDPGELGSPCGDVGCKGEEPAAETNDK